MARGETHTRNPLCWSAANSAKCVRENHDITSARRVYSTRIVQHASAKRSLYCMLRRAFACHPCSTIMLKSSEGASSIFSGSASSSSFCTINDDLVDDPSNTSSLVSTLISMVVAFRIPVSSLTALGMIPLRSVPSLFLVPSVESLPFASPLSSELLLTAGCSHI